MNRVQIGTKFGLQLRMLTPSLSGLFVEGVAPETAPVSTATSTLVGLKNQYLVNSQGDRRDYDDAYVRFTHTRNPLHQIVVPIVDFDPSSGTVYLQWAPTPGPVQVNDQFEVWVRTNPSFLDPLINKSLRRCREVTEIILMDNNDTYQSNAYSVPMAGLKKLLLQLPLQTINLLDDNQASCLDVTAHDQPRTPEYIGLLSSTLSVVTLPVLDTLGNIQYNQHDVQSVNHAIAVTTPGAVAGEGIETNYIELNNPALASVVQSDLDVTQVCGTVGLTGTGTVNVQVSLYDKFKTLLSTTNMPASLASSGGGISLPNGWSNGNFGSQWVWITVPYCKAPGAHYAKLRVISTAASAGTFYVSAPQLEPNPTATPWVAGLSVRNNPQIDSGAAIRDYWIALTGDPENRWALLQSNARDFENGGVEVRWGDTSIHSGRVVILVTRSPFQDLNDNISQVNIAQDYIVSAMGVEYFLAKSDEREGGARGDVDRQYGRWLTEFNRLHKRYAPQASPRTRLLY